MLKVLNHPVVFLSDPVQLEQKQNKSVQDQRIPTCSGLECAELLWPGPRQIDALQSRMIQDRHGSERTT